jgi:transposase InsO family protein
LLFVWLCQLFSSLRGAITIVQPDTVLRWHRSGFRLYWRWKSRSRGGRPKVPIENRSLIRRISEENRLWGAPRIHGELLKLGIEVAQSTVAKYMARGGRGRSQTWKTFLHNHSTGIGAMDFLIVPTAGFRLLFVLVILKHQRRRLISLTVTANPTAEWIARQITEAFPWDEAPDYLIRDRDASYGQAVTKCLAAMGIRDHPTAPRSPWQNGHAERLIGSIRGSVGMRSPIGGSAPDFTWSANIGVSRSVGSGSAAKADPQTRLTRKAWAKSRRFILCLPLYRLMRRLIRSSSLAA